MIDDDRQNQTHELRSFGRRRGRKRSARQNTIFKTGLARWGLADEAEDLADPAQLFSFAPSQIWLEIGFGGGEHLIWQAEHHPEIGFLAAEPFEDGVVKVLTAIEEKQLRNVRVFPGDARQVLRRLPPNSIDRVFVLFPDPWPKARHAKRRLVSTPLFTALSQILKDTAEVRIATDIVSYAAAILQTAHHHPNFRWQASTPSDWRQRPSDWPATRYETKARRADRKPYFFQFCHMKVGKPVADCR